MDQDRYSIDVIHAAIDILEAFNSNGNAPTKPSKLAQQTGINRTRTFRILKTLEMRGYVEADKNNDFQLSLKILQFAESVRARSVLPKVARPFLMELAQKTGDTVSLLVMHHANAICMDSFQGHYRLQVAVPIGQILPLHVGVSPKILLANLPTDERENLLQTIPLTPYTPNTLVNRDELRKVLDIILENGYAVDEEDFEIGVCAVGSPVRDQSGSVIAGITITTPKSRFDPQRREELIHFVTDVSNRISTGMGWKPNEEMDGPE